MPTADLVVLFRAHWIERETDGHRILIVETVTLDGRLLGIETFDMTDHEEA